MVDSDIEVITAGPRNDRSLSVNICEFVRTFVPVGLTKAEFDILKAWIADLPDVTSGPHRFGGIEFKVHGLEFMHFHGQTHLDIRLPMSDQARILVEGKAEKHAYAPQAGWVTFRIKSNEDIDKVKEIVRLAHNRALTVMEQHQTKRTTAK
jgi:hypothetical protein